MTAGSAEGTAVVRARRRVERDSVSRLAFVQSITEVGLLPLDPDETMRELLERVRVGLEASSSTILLLDETRQMLAVRASVGEQNEVVASLRIPMGQGITGRVAATRRPALVDEIAQAHPVQGLPGTLSTRSLAAVPLNISGCLLGVLLVASAEAAAFVQSDVAMLELVSDRVALAVERIRMTEREQAASAALRVSEQRARAVLDTAANGIITIDRLGRVESMNPAAERMFGYPSALVVGSNVSMLMPESVGRDHDSYLQRFHRTGERRVIGHYREVVGRRRDGTTFPLEVAVSDVGADVGLFTGVLKDVTERKEFEERLAHQAVHDPLTGLANRTLLLEHLEHVRARLPRHPGIVALLFVDLDRFKLVNDTLGHDAGDEVLTTIARLLRKAVRPEDMVARVGGDEFVVICSDLADPSEVEAIAQRVSQSLNVPQRVRGREVFLSASVGVVFTDNAARTGSELLQDADAAMYQAKEQRRGSYAMLDEAARSRMTERFQLSSEMQRAVERRELRACYQPHVDLVTGDIVAAEALLRWEHPTRGMLGPGQFLAIAEDLGTVVEFDAWIMRVACADTVDWARQLGRPIGVWVNVSGRSLADPGLLANVSGALAASGLRPELLTLEITEGALMSDAASTVQTLHALRRLGVNLAIDDFGTGYSSLAYLQEFPVTALKVDRSFVANLDASGSEAQASAAIVRAIVSLATSLGLRTVAEGIETPGQLAAVSELKCDLGQGFFLGRPAVRNDLLRAVPQGVELPSVFTPSALRSLGLDIDLSVEERGPSQGLPSQSFGDFGGIRQAG